MSQRFAGGLAWNIAGGVMRALSQFIGGAVLARILGPEPFGVMAVGWIMVQYARLIDPGMGAALVKHADPDRDDLRFATTMQVTVSVLLAVVLAACAGPCAKALGDPAAAPVIRALAILLPLGSFTQVSTALLERGMRFSTIQMGNLIPYLIGLAVGVPLAIDGAGAWSLVAVVVVQALGTAIWLYVATRHPLAPKWHHPNGRGMLGFGVHASGAALANSIATTADQVAVSHVAGLAELGQYNRAGGLLMAPMLTLTNALAVWIFPIFARTADPAVRRRQFLAVVPAAAGLTAIPFAVAAGGADAVVSAVYGPGWGLAAAVVQPIALTMPALTLITFASTLLWSADRVALDHRLQWLSTAAIVIGVAIAAGTGGGPLAIAWTVMGIAWLRALLLLSAAARVAGCGLWTVCRTLLAVGPLAVICGIAAHGIERLGMAEGISAWPLMAPLAGLMLSGCAFAWWLSCRSGVAGELRDVIATWRRAARNQQSQE